MFARGRLTAQLLIWYVGAIDYPLVIGGKPLFDFSYTIPITFELTVLFSAFGAFIGMFAMNGLPAVSSVVQASAARIARPTIAFCW